MHSIDRQKNEVRHSGDALLDRGQLARVSIIAERRTGRRPAPSTVWRWAQKGLRGGQVRLACLFHSGAWMTTPAAFEQFIADQTRLQVETSSEHDVTDDELRAGGLL